MKKILILTSVICFMFPLLSNAQTGTISLQVIAVKGTVQYQSRVLKKDDVISVPNLSTLPAALKYASAADWVNFINKKDKKILNYYAKKQTTGDGRYMFSRGVENSEFPAEWNKPGVKQLKGEKEVLLYFSRATLFMTGNDTLVCSGMKVYETSKGSGFMLEYKVGDAPFESLLGNNDTLYITAHQIFTKATGTAGKEAVNSYTAGPMKLVYYDAATQKKTRLELDEFSVYFLEDIVLGLRGIGLDDNDIAEEILYVFSEPGQLAAASGLTEDKKIKSWLLKKIKKIS